jgi:hypothetical protein
MAAVAANSTQKIGMPSLGYCFCFLNLSAFVVAARATSAVRNHGLAAIRTGYKLNGNHLIVIGAAHISL